MTDSVTRDTYLSIVISAYNEEKRLQKSLPLILDYVKNKDFKSEIIIVDDGSSDRTAEIAETFLADITHAVVRKQPSAGKGAGIRSGMKIAQGQWRLMCDADLSTPIHELDKFWNVLQDKPQTDIIIGSRALMNSELAVRQPFYREFMGRVFNVCVQMLVLPGIHDTQCGFKLFNAKAAETIFPMQKANDFSFDVELLLLARKYHFEIVEYPIRWVNDSASKVNPIFDSLKMFWALLRLRKQITGTSATIPKDKESNGE